VAALLEDIHAKARYGSQRIGEVAGTVRIKSLREAPVAPIRPGRSVRSETA